MAEPTNKLKKIRRSMHSLVTELSLIVRDLYIASYRKRLLSKTTANAMNWNPGPYWDGGTTSLGAERPNVWPGAASFVIKRQLPVGEFVRFVVFDWTMRPQPNHLKSPAAATAFFDQDDLRRRTARQDMLLAFQHQQDAAAHATDFYYSMAKRGFGSTEGAVIRKMVLRDEEYDLTSLFRYCSAMESGLTEIAEEYYSAALVQYLVACRSYDTLWGDWIPDRLKRASARLRDMLGVKENHG